MPLPKAYVDKEAFSRRLSELIRAFEPCPDKYDAVVAVQSVFDSFPYITIPADHIGDATKSAYLPGDILSLGIKSLAARLESLEEKAGDEGWGGDFREEMFDEMIRWAQEPRKYSSLGLLLTHLIIVAEGGEK